MRDYGRASCARSSGTTSTWAGGVIHVRRSMDASGELILPKSKAGTRSVPIPKVLRGILLEHRLRNGASRYAFDQGDRPVPAEIPSIGGVGLHDCRHAYASFAIGAGINLKTLSLYMGHSSVAITADRYGHLFPGNEAEAARVLDLYFARRVTPACPSRRRLDG